MTRKTILFEGIKFQNIEYINLMAKIKKGGVLVAPAASALIDITRNKDYYKALLKSDFAILDSGLLCILLRFFRGEKAKKLSGYLFLKKFISSQKNKKDIILSVDPSDIDEKINNEYFKNNKIFNVFHYVAPVYVKSRIKDIKLLNKIKKIRPKYILINIGGGVQEVLGIYLRDNLNYKPVIICTGAAIAFLTKRQAPINIYVDKFYMGWLMRIIYNPKIFLYRTLRSVKLIKFFI